MNTKRSGRSVLRIVLVGDAHLGPNSETRPGEEAAALLVRFVDRVNDEIQPDMVLEMGDRINNHSPHADRENARKASSVLKGLSAPCCYIVGNHDIHHLSKEENREIYGGPVVYRTTVINGYKFVFLDTTEPVIEHVGGNTSEQQLHWLKSELQGDDLPKIIVAHHPLDERSSAGNPHFVRFPHYAYLKNGAEVTDALNAGRNVVAYFSGHVHWLNHIVENSFCQISVPSFTECWPETRNAPGTFAETSIFDDGRLETTIRSLSPERTLGRFIYRRPTS